MNVLFVGNGSVSDNVRLRVPAVGLNGLGVKTDVKHFDADGCVVGATGHVSENDIRLIREMVGQDKVFLVPGVGAQKGDPEKVIKAGGKNVLINVGRDVIYTNNPSGKAKEYTNMLNKIRIKYLK